MEHQTGEVGVQPLVPGDEFVGEGQSGHESALLQPEDGRERAGEEDPLDACVGDHPLCEGGRLRVGPLHSPLCLLLDCGHRLQRVEESVALLRLADVRVDEQAVHLAVDVLDGDLEL